MAIAAAEPRFGPTTSESRGRTSSGLPCRPGRIHGSHKSKLIAVLRSGHYDVKLPREDFVRLVTWGTPPPVPPAMTGRGPK
jgi:hypothetical protein